MRDLVIIVAGAAALMSAGYIVGSRNAPAAIDSELAEAQVVAQDRDVRWIAYGCGEDGATLITRDMPNVMECRSARRLRDDAEFPAPPR